MSNAEIKFEYEEMITPVITVDVSKGKVGKWNAGDQVDALKIYLKKEVEVLWEYTQNDYQGDCFALMKYKDQFVLWRDSFGSCSGCDALDGEDLFGGYDYIKKTMTEGNCLRFDNIKDVLVFMLSPDIDYLWEELKDTTLPAYIGSLAIRENFDFRTGGS